MTDTTAPAWLTRIYDRLDVLEMAVGQGPVSAAEEAEYVRVHQEESAQAAAGNPALEWAFVQVEREQERQREIYSLEHDKQTPRRVFAATFDRYIDRLHQRPIATLDPALKRQYAIDDAASIGALAISFLESRWIEEAEAEPAPPEAPGGQAAPASDFNAQYAASQRTMRQYQDLVDRLDGRRFVEADSLDELAEKLARRWFDALARMSREDSTSRLHGQDWSEVSDKLRDRWIAAAKLVIDGEVK